MSDLGKFVIAIGIGIVVLGLIMSLFDRIPLIGKLPGDIYIKKDGFTFYFPVTTSILISIILSVLIRLFNR